MYAQEGLTAEREGLSRSEATIEIKPDGAIVTANVAGARQSTIAAMTRAPDPSDTLNLGPINGHAVGRILKEAVRRATVTIRAERAAFEVQAKAGAGGEMDDVCTSADRKAQEIYLRSLRECFPLCGVVAEEEALSVAPGGAKGGACAAYFTVDPLDGTRAFVRRQSHGVGTMVALVEGQQVLAAYVGDVNTEEVYGYRPGSATVHRITRLDAFEKLSAAGGADLAASYALLRAPASRYGPLARRTVERFKSHEVDGGSIGIWLARLWKREVAAALLRPARETPWDSAPIVGISLKLGYAFLRPSADGARWERYTPALSRTPYMRDHDTLVVHQDDAAQVMA